jgi:hypothetical protein
MIAHLQSIHFNRREARAQRRSLSLLPLLAANFAVALACGGNDAKKSTAAQETAAAAQETTAAPLEPTPGGNTPNGLSVPAGVANWGVIGVAAHSDDGSLRVIVGNETAVAAARSGQTNPWPEGTMLSHFVWDGHLNPNDPAKTTVGPGNFEQLTLMVKDSSKYAADGGWAYGVWMGSDLTPPTDPAFDRACVSCHTSKVADKDFVFTVPGPLPAEAALSGAMPAGNGIAFPSKILDWKVIGVADELDPMNPTIRVIVGNPTAVAAARSGQTKPWPDGSMISHYVWSAGTNPAADGVTVPANFGAFTYMQRSSALYGSNGEWGYGLWTTPNLMPFAAGADQACIDCHTSNVPQRDYVFTEVGQFPAALIQ